MHARLRGRKLPASALTCRYSTSVARRRSASEQPASTSGSACVRAAICGDQPFLPGEALHLPVAEPEQNTRGRASVATAGQIEPGRGLAAPALRDERLRRSVLGRGGLPRPCACIAARSASPSEGAERRREQRRQRAPEHDVNPDRRLEGELDHQRGSRGPGSPGSGWRTRPARRRCRSNEVEPAGLALVARAQAVLEQRALPAARTAASKAAASGLWWPIGLHVRIRRG